MPTANPAKLETLLHKRTKEDLITWVTDRAHADEDLHRELTAWLAPQTETRALASTLRSQITQAWTKVRSSRNPWKMARPTASALEPVLEALETLVDRGDAQAAEPLLARFHDAAESGCESIDDSYGILWPVLQDGVRVWGLAWAQLTDANPGLRPDLAARVRDGVLDNPVSIRDHMIRDFAGALGTDGLCTLEQLLHEQADRDADDPDLAGYDRGRATHHLASVADALGDPDRYIEARRRGAAEAIYGLPIARRLLDGGRAEEALARLDALAPNRQRFDGEPEDAPTLRIRCLRSLGREDEARQQLWRAFVSTLSHHALDRLRDLTPAPEHAALRERALTAAAESPSPLHAAIFYVHVDEIPRAAQAAVDSPDAFHGGYHDTLLRLIDAFIPGHPRAAWHLYRNLLVDVLDDGRHHAYGHAAEYFRCTRVLARQAGLGVPQQELEDRLQRDHKRKASFWKKVTS